ncbi:xanthine dehydrogenase accessory protein XdhC [Pannonibacter tanglangensis]|uniref:Xanthine dehydrogenase accessory protein XdhC n=1 Tax=Pannonibacter tanglangensis TaxID=2750084 RepID=A0ABW9ZBZ2_9HYPH|nr:xanthine dehydrogenase accessory protein XdhC [Pannonibacter sp. XCT-34]NBN62171.1 xanthine dehydrogenase accessory protein XdhC [Pannonibacter sp. XCT-34]
MSLWRRMSGCLERDGACALVTVAEVAGSAPREVGARMIVRADGSLSGTIGGGTLEFEAIRWAMAALAAGRRELVIRRVSLGPDLGQCCGGRVDVAVETFSVADRGEVSALAAREAEGGRFVTRRDPVTGLRKVQTPDTGGPLAAFTRAADGAILEVFGTTDRPVWLFGAGHVGRAVVLALAPLPFAVTWIDSRPEMFPAAMPGDLTCIAHDRPADLVDKAPADAFVLIMTHSHALDEDIAAAALRTGRFPYVGVIGSATKRARFVSRLGKRGIAPAAVAALVCPVGAGGVASKLPAAIAASIAVELLVTNEAANAESLSNQTLALGSGLRQ